jgi:Carboxypeptidase regulatory-like domain
VPWIAALTVLALCGADAAALPAQDQRNGPELRTVHGTVIDRSENPVPTSIVYLRNMKTQGVKTYITSNDGLYRFSGLDPNVDYQLHAEHNGLISSVHTVSSYDSRRDIDMPLKLSHKKDDH